MNYYYELKLSGSSSAVQRSAAIVPQQCLNIVHNSSQHLHARDGSVCTGQPNCTRISFNAQTIFDLCFVATNYPYSITQETI